MPKCFVWKKKSVLHVHCAEAIQFRYQVGNENLTTLYAWVTIIIHGKTNFIFCIISDIVCIFKTIPTLEVIGIVIYSSKHYLINILNHSLKHTGIRLFIPDNTKNSRYYAKQIYFNTRRWNVRQLCSSKSIYLLTNILT